MCDDEGSKGIETSFLASWVDWVLVFGLVAGAPTLFIHASNLWARPHYQFFPVAWLAFGFLLISRHSLRLKSGIRPFFGWLLLLVSLGLQLTASLLFSPWVTHCSVTLLLVGWMLLRISAKWYSVCALTSLLLITIPPPVNLDARLIQSLQAVSTRSASRILDLLEVPHLTLGNVIEVSEGKLFVDEACSGVGSLYALAAIILLSCLINRLSAALSFCLLILVPAATWIGNTLRLTTIAFMLEFAGIDLAHGLPHTLLGLTIFALVLLLIVSTQHALEYIFSAPSSRLGSWKNLLAWPQRDRWSSLPQMSIRWSRPLPRYGLVGIPLSMGFIACLGLTMANLLADSNIARITGYSQARVESTFHPEVFGEQWQGMQRLGFKIEQRESASYLGEFSATWTFLDGEQTVVLSFDFPFLGYHGLEHCYVTQGKQLANKLATHKLGDHFVDEVHLVDNYGSISYLAFTQFDSAGNSWRRHSKAFSSLGQSQHIFQVQILRGDSGFINPEDRGRNRAILASAADVLFEKVKVLAQTTAQDISS